MTPLPTDRPRPNYTLGDNLPRDDMRFIGNLRYSFPFIQEFTADHHVNVRELREEIVNGQRWLRFDLP